VLKKPTDYLLKPIRVFQRKSSLSRPACCYDPEDVQVLQKLAPQLEQKLMPGLTNACFHLKGRGGHKAAVRKIDAAIKTGNYRYVCRSDAKSYYDSIDTDLLMVQLRQYVRCRQMLSLLYQYLHRCVCRDGIFRCVDQGIPHGGVLSPLLAALYMAPLDRSMEALGEKGIFYIRYMDDWVILAPNRYKLREAVAKMNAVLAELKLEKHPDKTFIGRLSHGFDALGYQFSEEDGLCGPSATAIQRFGARIVERYAQHESRESLLQYVTRWLGYQFGSKHATSGMFGSETKIQTIKNNNNNENTTQLQIHAAMETHKTVCACSCS
jgi:hypothetical protein